MFLLTTNITLTFSFFSITKIKGLLLISGYNEKILSYASFKTHDLEDLGWWGEKRVNASNRTRLKKKQGEEPQKRQRRSRRKMWEEKTSAQDNKTLFHSVVFFQNLLLFDSIHLLSYATLSSALYLSFLSVTSFVFLPKMPTTEDGEDVVASL